MMAGDIDLSVVIPVHNEARAVRVVWDEVKAASEFVREFMGSDWATEILFVDDGSYDGTAGELSRLDGIRILRHKRKLGYGAALQTGFSSSHGNWVAMLDGDYSYPPGAIPALVHKAIESEADLVVGTRYGNGNRHISRVRRVGNFIFRTTIRSLTGHQTSDPTSGMRIFRKEIVEKLGRLPTGFDLGLSMTIRALMMGLTVREIPLVPRPRIGRSKVFLPTAGPRFLLTILHDCFAWKRRDLGQKSVAVRAMTPAN